MARSAESIEQRPRAGRRVMALIALLALLLFGAALAYLYAGGGRTTGPIPVVRAPDGPIKVKPARLGGMDVPHRDKKVFQALAGEPAAAEAQLAPPPEEPVDLSALEQSPDPIGRLIEESGVDTADEMPDQPPAAGAPDPLLPRAKPEPQVAAAPSPGKWRVQLGAFTQRGQTAAYWDRLVEEHGALLLGLSMDIDATTRRGRDFFRLRAGPLSDQAAAKRLCAAMEQAGKGCLVIAPAP
ncbi:MAG: SPOR domain-containing protein [Rhodothalassiaceae bacterium]